MKDPTSALLTVDRAADWLTSGGQIGRLVRSMDWSKTPLGPIESGARSLKALLAQKILDAVGDLTGDSDGGTNVEITGAFAATRRSDLRRARA